MENHEVSLGEFVKLLMLRFDSQGMTMPLRDEKPWHMLFYKLKVSGNAVGKPDFLRELLFDWDGPYPRSSELAEYLDTLHWTGCLSASNPQYDTVTVNSKVRQIWSDLPTNPELSSFVDHAVQAAKGPFDAAANVNAPRLSNAI